MTTPRRAVSAAAAALVASLAATRGALAQPTHIDMYYNPAPVIGDTEVIDLTIPPFYSPSSVFLYVKFGPPQCSVPASCQGFTPIPLGPVSSYTYEVNDNVPGGVASFFFKTTKNGISAYSDVGVVTISAANVPMVETAHPILFVTQVPTPDDFINVVAPFGSHQSRPGLAPRGGDLYIRYPEGRLKNLTKAAGYGNNGLQAANAIAVRDPAVHWSGTKAIFSMILGAPTTYGQPPGYWQLYEVNGLGPDETPVITRIGTQPPDYNNVSPVYGSDGRIIFTSDRPRSGARHLYPQIDEYEAQPTNTGLWCLDPCTGDLVMLQHSPSGSFKPTVDSYGRVIYTRWDHLQRDIQRDQDLIQQFHGGQPTFATFNWSDEGAAAAITPSNEYFPESTTHWVYFRTHDGAGYSGDPNGYREHLTGNTFSRFLPWTIRQDGTEEETLNHIGRHELLQYTPAAFTAAFDPNLVGSQVPGPNRANQNPIQNFFQIRESPIFQGFFLGIDAPEFFTHASGRILAMSGQPNLNADQMTVIRVTNPAGGDHYRNPVHLTDGQLVSVHTPTTGNDFNVGTPLQPLSRYDYRIKTLEQAGSYWTANRPLTHGIQKSVLWYDHSASPSQFSYSGQLWELDPVEVVARPAPPNTAPVLPLPEQLALAAASVSKGDLVQFLRDNDLALIVSRNVTARDRNDRLQPFNLRVPGTPTQSIATGGTVYNVRYLQLFQGDQVRSMYWGNPTPRDGRRVLARPLHETTDLMPPLVPAAPPGSVLIGADGSTAALVPARRAMTWQLTNGPGVPIVRERYWVTFQPGEIRSCAACHGVNTADQLNRPLPTNTPQALTDLVLYLQSIGQLPSGGPAISQHH